ELDRLDPLAQKRNEFELPEDVIYLDGNSLGPLPKAASERSSQVIRQQWGRDLVKSWNLHQWIDLPARVGEKIAPLLGAGPGQVTCCDSTSVNLFKLLCSALHMQPGRRVVISQAENFPADLYIAQGLSQLGQDGLCVLESVPENEIETRLGHDVAVLMLTQVNFRSGRLHDMRRLTELAHSKGIMVIWDLAHSAGAVPLELDDWQVDFAVGCGYKFLNGGPGAPAFVYVAERHQDSVRQPLTGWMGHAAPFSFAEDYNAAPGVTQFLCGTPPIVSMSVLDAALSVFGGVDMQQVRAKSVGLSELFLELVSGNDALAELHLVSPRDSRERGSQLAFAHPSAYAICQALIERGVIVDFRSPDILRIGIAPLYIRYRDMSDAAGILADIMRSEVYMREKYSQRQKVT
ncbi:MAG: kynureninase, partial [Lysobacterales bacterium]